MNIQELNEILDVRRKEMRENGLSYNFNNCICSCWNKYINYLKDNNLYHDEISKKRFLNYYETKVRRRDFYYYQHAMTIIDGIDKLDNYANRQRIIRYEKDYLLTDNNKLVMKNYIKSRSEYNSKKTIEDKKVILRDIMIFCFKNEINDYSKLSVDKIIKIKNYCLSFKLYSKKKLYIWVLRDFLSFLYEEQYVNTNYSIIIDKIQKATKKLPVTWNKEEVEKIVTALPDETPTEIRNKAMALLTIRLGIRFIDVKNLKFENINWKNNTIEFVQRKTNSYLKLPLPEEVGIAIIRYIKNYRPKTTEKYVFITHDENVKKLSDRFNIRQYLIKTYNNAKVDYLSKDNVGIHTFRHSLATNMLKERIPLNIISSTLGHLNQNSTKVYISLDDALLKECCLDLECDINE